MVSGSSPDGYSVLNENIKKFIWKFITKFYGTVAEWLKALDCKSTEKSTLVRIQPGLILKKLAWWNGRHTRLKICQLSVRVR